MKNPMQYIKAVLAGAVAFAGAGATAAATDGISEAEWWAIAATTLVALASVYAVPNREVQDNYIPDAWDENSV